MVLRQLVERQGLVPLAQGQTRQGNNFCSSDEQVLPFRFLMLLLDPATNSVQAVRRAAQSVSVKPKQQAIQIWSAQYVCQVDSES